MNRFFRTPRQHAAVLFVLFSLIYCCELSRPLPAYCENAIAEELISLDANNQPLGEILDDISAETGYQFRIDESWNDFPVTASIKNEPLHKGLKRILRNLNSAVIYGPDRTIRIKIYDQEKSTGQPAGQAIVNRSYEETLRQPVISRNPRPLNPGAQLRNRKTPAQTDEQASEENSESVSEPEETEEVSGTANEEEASDSGTKSAENTSEESGEETAETNAASETTSESGAADNE